MVFSHIILKVQNIQTTSNVGVPGKWIFRVDQPIGVPSQPPFVPPSPPSPPPPSPPLVPTSPPIYFVTFFYLIPNSFYDLSV
jgi:hypothetical protein